MNSKFKESSPGSGSGEGEGRCRGERTCWRPSEGETAIRVRVPPLHLAALSQVPRHPLARAQHAPDEVGVGRAPVGVAQGVGVGGRRGRQLARERGESIRGAQVDEEEPPLVSKGLGLELGLGSGFGFGFGSSVGLGLGLGFSLTTAVRLRRRRPRQEVRGTPLGAGGVL